MIYHPYTDPEAVGYRAAIRLFGRCVAFIALDGCWIWRW